MTRPALVLPLLALLGFASALSLAWAAQHALATSKDLMYRRAEVERFVVGEDPYRLESMTYPPSALPVFAALIAPFGPEAVKSAWLVLNLGALAAVAAAVVRLWGEGWPVWAKATLILVIISSKPVRGGIGLGQFHLVPLLLMLLALWALRGRRPVVAGLLLGIALAKPTMALPFLGVLAARRHWRALAVAGAVQAVSWIGASAWLGIGPVILLREWLANARGQLAEGAIDLPTIAQRVGLSVPSGGAGLSLALLAVAFAVLLVYRRRSTLALASFATFAAAVSTYHRHYDLVLLIPSLAATFDAAVSSSGRRAAWMNAALAATFSLLLIAPNDPSVAGRLGLWYGPALVLGAYAFLALVAIRLIRGPDDFLDRLDGDDQPTGAEAPEGRPIPLRL